MRVLVLGADGFVGRHLVEHLRHAGDTVVEGIGPHGQPNANRYPIDVRHADAVKRLVREAAPEAIYHLAAVAYGPDATKDLAMAVEVTIGGTANVLDAMLACDPPPILLVTGSSEVYGAPVVEVIDESVPTHPSNLYGATKVAQETLALTFGHVHQRRVIVTRSFNHIGPGQRDAFAVASFARQLREIEAGSSEHVLRVGNLESVRDFTDVRDVVRAYRLLVAGGHTGAPLNVASGQGRTLRSIVDELVSVSGLRIEIETDPARVRMSDPPRIVGDASQLHRLTGWSPEIPIGVTLRDIWASLHEPTA